MQRSKRKKENKAKLAASREKVKPSDGLKRGFRAVHIEGQAYQWRYYGARVEIRTPGKLSIKWLVPIWALHGQTQDEWFKAHAECDEYCDAYAIRPSMVRDYILEMRKATCEQSGS